MELEQIEFGKTEWPLIDAALIGYDAKQSSRDYWLGKCVLDVSLRELFHAAGFVSLANYLEIRVGWDPHTTSERLRTAKRLEELPLMAQELREGRIRWTAARELSRIATEKTEREWIDWSRNKNTHAIAFAVKTHRVGDRPTDPPDPTLFRQKLSFECNSEQYAVIKAAIEQMRSTLGPAGHELSEAALLALALCGGIEEMRLDLTQCTSCRAAGIRVSGNVIPVEPTVASVAACSAQIVDEDGTVRSRHVPEPTERAVRLRAGYACEVPGCRRRWWCRVHHLILFSEGGTHSAWNLMLLCDGHHRLLHDGVLLAEGSRRDGFKFMHADGTEIGRLPAYDRVKAFKNAFDALLHAGLPEGQVREALRYVREQVPAGTEEEILDAASRWLVSNPSESGMTAGEAVAEYRLRVPQGTARARPAVESPRARGIWWPALWPRNTSRPLRRMPAPSPSPSLGR